MSRLQRWRLVLAHTTLATACVVMLITSRSVTGRGTTGDFPLFVQAGRALLAGEPLHAANRGYLYGPFPALLFAMLSPLGQAGCAWAMGVFNAAALWLCVMTGARAALRAFAVQPGALINADVALIGLLLTLDKARSVINGGQTDLLVLLPIVLALAWQDRRPTLAGIALGFAANIKYTTLVFFPYMLWRRQWRACGAMMVSTLAFALLPAAVCGWSRNLDHWRSALSGLGSLVGVRTDTAAAPVGDVTFDQSISISSAIARWLIPVSGRAAADLATAVVAIGVLACSWLLYRRARIPLPFRPATDAAEPSLRWLEWSGLIVALLAFSPQTQGRHFVLLLPLYLAAGVMLCRPRAPRRVLLLGLLVMQAGLILPPPGLSWSLRAMPAWRAVGGASWCAIIFFLAYLNTGLRTARSIHDAQPTTPAS